jgi:sigma-B regulation protein RsbU (phosphoserine phosphatase)
VGGDLYDFDWSPETGVLQAMVGDVSGKSIPAALYGAVFSGHVRTLFAHPYSPGQKLALLNGSLIARYPVNNYIAVAHLRLEVRGGTGVIANGGMPYPYIVRGPKVSRVCVPGVPLGLLEGVTYEEAPVALEKGDMLILTSDGATDAANSDGQPYDSQRLVESIRRRSSSDDISRVVTGIFGDIAEYSTGAELHDDVTIVAIRRCV